MLGQIAPETMGTVVLDTIQPKTVSREDKSQKTDNEGTPLWTVTCMVREPGSQFSDRMRVTIASKDKPGAALEPYAHVTFEGLLFHHVRRGTENIVWYTAKSVKAA